MIHISPLLRKSRHHNVLRRARPHMHKYRELTRWQRQAQGIRSRWGQSQSHRQLPFKDRFNPEGVGLTRGTSPFAWQWWHTQYPWLPNIPTRKTEGGEESDYRFPTPMGFRPSTWDDEFAEVVLSMSNEEIREYLMGKLTEVIFTETQRDGYELRRLDFEGNPLTSLPEPRIIENFVFEEETLRERVIQQVVESLFRLTPTSTDRKELRSVSHIIDFILTHVTAARPMPIRSQPSTTITPAALAVMQSCEVQPEFGFIHALPEDTRDVLLQEWERMHHLDWQFGKAVYTPRSREKDTRGNLTWLREEQHHTARLAFMKAVEDGTAKAEHMKRIAEAAGSINNSNTNTMNITEEG
ncbi:uncharacterized protein TM35_000063570 [Trypanosoma theileri]|uniref:Uncharacterized protein n=1 Tax=Trypanosoma theileri TaxID=67003 RepID=A0A1X0P370_9TRYP|nr:uncharacterized protein TM35_000063570 [Trypanosoma theileri]ORC91352.1 hypothetical protein TM35_000063570 [Trypanosoma theileri]